MTNATLHRPRHPAHQVPQRGSAFTGTPGMLRLYLRRDRIVLPLWVLLLSVPLATVYIGSIEKVYPGQAARAAFAASIMASPAQRALYGQIYNDSLGASGIWKAGVFHLLIAVAVILTVIRHTRADEETGRAELIDSTAVGRYASLTAAVLLSFGASIITGALGTAGLLTTSVPPDGSLAFGAALAGSGLVFTAVAAVAAQLSPSARFARGAAFTVLATAFSLRAVGDAGSGTLSWLSPLGWSLQVRPYAGDRWWVLLLHLATTVILTVLAYQLLARRDIGAGLIAERPGRGNAAPMLRSAFGLAWRLDRGTLLLWMVGLCLYGLLIGSIVHGIGDEVGDSTAVRDIVTRMGGSNALEQAFIAVAFCMLGMVAAACTISLTLRLHQEESSQHAETLLAGAVGRSRWLSSHLTIALMGSGAGMLVAGLAAGLAYGVAANDVRGKLAMDLPGFIATAVVQLPAVWLFAAVTVAMFGLMPRLTPVVWGVLVGFIALYLLGSLSGAPQWLLNIEPFAHIPRVGRGEFTTVPLVFLLAIDAALIGLGAATFRRRDLRS
ncbi:MAG: ABC transporter permease [Mycobacterium sp.]|nr:ABC transporter permease [Mycobacterium sp.]